MATVGVVVLFEAGMPLVGLAIGAPVAHLIGAAAEYIAAVVLVATGAWMIFSDNEDEEQAAGGLLSAGGWAVIALGLSISLDELAIGFTLGVARLSAGWVIVAIGCRHSSPPNSALPSVAGLASCGGQSAERLAGLMLIVLDAGHLGPGAAQQRIERACARRTAMHRGQEMNAAARSRPNSAMTRAQATSTVNAAVSALSSHGNSKKGCNLRSRCPGRLGGGAGAWQEI